MDNKRLCIAALVLTAALTLCRVLLLPGAVPEGSRMGTVSYPLLGIMAAAVAASLWAGYRRGEYLPLTGAGAGGVAVTGLALGAVMLSFTAVDLYGWLVKGAVPAPFETVANGVEQGVLILSAVSGLLAGMFLLVYFVGWKAGPYGPLNKVIALPLTAVGAAAGIGLIVSALRADKIGAAQMVLIAVGGGLLAAFVLWQIRGRFSTGWLWLLPPLWVFARLVRYDVHFAMSVDVSAGVYEMFSYGVAALFMLAFAQYMSGAMKPTRHMRGLACAAAALCLSAPLSRLALTGEAAARFNIPDPPILMVGAFALAATVSLTQAEKPVGEEPAPEGSKAEK